MLRSMVRRAHTGLPGTAQCNSWCRTPHIRLGSAVTTEIRRPRPFPSCAAERLSFIWCWLSLSCACASPQHWVSSALSHVVGTCALLRPATVCPPRRPPEMDLASILTRPCSSHMPRVCWSLAVHAPEGSVGLRLWVMWGRMGSAGVLPDLLIPRVEPRPGVEILGPLIALAEVDQSWRGVFRVICTGLPGTDLSNFLNRTEVDIPDLGTGVVCSSLVDTTDAFLAPSLVFVRSTLCGLVPIFAATVALVLEVVRLLLPRSCRSPFPTLLPSLPLPCTYPFACAASFPRNPGLPT